MKTKLNYHDAITQNNGYVKIHFEDLNSIVVYLTYAETKLREKGRDSMADNSKELWWKLSDIIDTYYD